MTPTKWKLEHCFKNTRYPQNREYCPYSIGGWTAMCLAVPERRGCNDYWYPTPIAKVRREQCPVVNKKIEFPVLKQNGREIVVNGEIGNPAQFSMIKIG